MKILTRITAVFLVFGLVADPMSATCFGDMPSLYVPAATTGFFTNQALAERMRYAVDLIASAPGEHGLLFSSTQLLTSSPEFVYPDIQLLREAQRSAKWMAAQYQVRSILDRLHDRYQPKDAKRLDLTPPMASPSFNVVYVIKKAIQKALPEVNKLSHKYAGILRAKKILIGVTGSTSYLTGEDGKPLWEFIGENHGKRDLDIHLYVPDEWIFLLFSPGEPLASNAGVVIYKAIHETLERSEVFADIRFRPFSSLTRVVPKITSFPYHPNNWYWGSTGLMRALRRLAWRDRTSLRQITLEKYGELYNEVLERNQTSPQPMRTKIVKRLILLALMRGDEEDVFFLKDILLKPEANLNPFFIRAAPLFALEDIVDFVRQYELTNISQTRRRDETVGA